MKKTVAVFFGGRSTEHDISIITALSSVIKPLELSKHFDVVPIYITKTGKWISDDKLKNVELYRTKKIDELVAKSKPVQITFDGGLTLDKKRIDVAFPSMHGSYGEDGSLMGFLRMANIPFVGADMDASVIAMDKVLAKQVAVANDIPVSKFVFFSRTDILSDANGAAKISTNELNFPLFVKPAHLGSSIGISRVTTNKELINALEVAAYYDEKIIVEEAVNNLIEVTVPLIGNEEIEPALVERPLTHSEEFFDFDTKYINGGKKGGGKAGAQGYSELPAKLPGTLYDQSLDVAKAVYKAIGASGISRVDLLIDSKTSKVYFNEVNPLPGDLYRHNWRAAGVSSVELVTKLVHFAEKRYAEKQSLNTTFDSNFLQQF
ncbi:MAG: D-alanine--D-alanine ligase [Candidatus Saccharibacteria bacterium]|nr:D-alanine--D-alanine ligase [Candidatus Saccharibacteria bacterium]